MSTFDVIVIGTGGVGSSALSHLSRRGVHALGIDRFPPGHDRGSSHGHTRVIRLAYFEHPDYVPLLRRAYDLWRELEETREEKLYHQVGVLQVGLPEGEVIAGVRASAKMHGLQVEDVPLAEFARRFPGFGLADDHAALFEERAGYLLVERSVIAHAEEAVRHGAVLASGEEVRAWRIVGDGVIVETDRNQYAARRLIITAGAWAGQLLADLGIPLRVLRKQLHWFAPQRDLYRETTGSPCFLYDLPEGFFYGFPQLDERGVKVAEHSGGREITDPLDVDRELDERDSQTVANFIKHHMPAMSTKLVDYATCLYTMSPDGHFIVDRHPQHSQVSFAAGLSGHGFKFTSVLGEILAELALDGRASLPIEFLSARRDALRSIS
jgi:sarcosine oxidase